MYPRPIATYRDSRRRLVMVYLQALGELWERQGTFRNGYQQKVDGYPWSPATAFRLFWLEYCTSGQRVRARDKDGMGKAWRRTAPQTIEQGGMQ